MFQKVQPITKAVLLLFFALLGSTVFASVKFSGSINGKYKFQMELVDSELKGYNLRGRYNYVGKTASMDIKGNFYGDGVMHLEESFEGKQTGEFFVEYSSERSGWVGTWISGTKHFPVEMRETEGSTDELVPYDLAAFTENANSSITGSYVSEFYWINDFNFSDESPVLEIGFNGGPLTIKELGKDKISFRFELVCGPTYHFATLEGIATRVSANRFEYKDSPYGDEEICHVTFTFGDKSVELGQESGNMECGFGARAYAGGTFQKVNNVAVTPAEDEELTVEGVLPKH